jgi:heme O synthase-like polyprenyltransferase
MVPLLAMLPISLLQSPSGSHAIFWGAELLLGIGFAYYGGAFIFQQSRVAAKRLLVASIVYLRVLFALSTVFAVRLRADV